MPSGPGALPGLKRKRESCTFLTEMKSYFSSMFSESSAGHCRKVENDHVPKPEESEPRRGV